MQRRIGRERDADEEGEKPELIEVSDTLGAKSRGEELNDYELLKLINEAQSEINEQRFKRNGADIEALFAEIVPAQAKNRVDDKIKAKITCFTEFADDVSDRPSHTNFVNVSDFSNVLSSITASLHGDETNRRYIDLLTPILNAIMVRFNPDLEAAEFADQFVVLVLDYIERHQVDFARIE